MNTEERMHDLFAGVIIPDSEPELPDFRPAARADGRRLRRRHNAVRGTVGLALAGAVLASGFFAVGSWPGDEGAVGTVPAATGAAETPEARLLAALRANLPAGFVSVEPQPVYGAYELTRANGEVVSVAVVVAAPAGQGLSSCATQSREVQPIQCPGAFRTGSAPSWESTGTLQVVPGANGTMLVLWTNPADNRADQPGELPDHEVLLALTSTPAVIDAIRALPATPPLGDPTSQPTR